MNSELCFHVDEEDKILSTMSKLDSHRIDPNTLKVPLHRAFSVFLVTKNSELLLQKRAHHKLTFPLLWSNSCCSHPIFGLGEDTPDVIEGIAKAAHRKLNHELGIPLSIVNTTIT